MPTVAARSAKVCGVVLALLRCLPAVSAPGSAGPLPAYTLHFEFIHSPSQARQSVIEAARAGARAVSLVPPAHVWEDPNGLRSLQAALAEARRLRLRIIFSRIDASQTNGRNWLFSHALTKPGRMPDGSPSTGDLFCTTVGNHPFEKWQRDETRYCARHFGRSPGLLAAAVGGMVEPFASERGSLLDWSKAADTYEIAQYTPEGMAEWHRWLRARFGGVAAVNRSYRTRFASIDAVPMPRSGADRRFGTPREAYYDFAECLNDWFLRQYRTNRRIWREGSRAPFLLQLSGGVAEKIARGRPEFAAFDLPGWLSEADAVGISLYTHAGYPDWCHSWDMATLQMVAGAQESGKPAVVMESGCEAPRVTAAPHELSFATRMGLLIRPSAYVYEYFRYSRDGRVDPGMMLTPDGQRHEPGYSAVSSAMRGLRQLAPVRQAPCFTYLTVPRTARASELAGRVNRAVYCLAGSMPCRLLPWSRRGQVADGAVVLVPPALETVLPRRELRAFAAGAAAHRWDVAGDAATCAALHRAAARVRAHPLSLPGLLAARSVEEEADILRRRLSAIPAFAKGVREQPLDPRLGLTWMQSGRRLYAWVEDSQPVRCRVSAARRAGVSAIWCSTRSGKRATLVLAGGRDPARRWSLPCRSWVRLDSLAGVATSGE